MQKSELVHDELGKLGARLALPPEIREASERLAANLARSKAVDRVAPSVIAASSLYAVCRDYQAALTLKEVAEASGVSKTEIGRWYRQAILELGLKPRSQDAALYAMRVAERLRASEKVVNLSSLVVRKAIEAGLEGKNPMTLAAAAIYTASLISGENVTQSVVSEAAGISEASVRDCAKAIRMALAIGPKD